jgi:hypothetical protein
MYAGVFKSKFASSKQFPWQGQMRGFLFSAASSFIILQFLWLGLMSFLYGSQYQSGERVHNLHVVAVDYDQGVIGKSLLGANQLLQGSSFPTLEVYSFAEYPSEASLEKAVRTGKYWAAIYSLPGASDRLSAAVQGRNSEISFNNTESIRYIWNEARYPAVAQGLIQASLEELIVISRSVYYQLTASTVGSTLNISNPFSLAAFVNPIMTSSINIKSTNQGSRDLYSAASIALHMIQDFFFVVAFKYFSMKSGIFSNQPKLRVIAIRSFFYTFFTFVSSLCWTGYLFAFQEDWSLDGGQFMLLWMIAWLFLQIDILVVDIITAYFAKASPLLIISWIVFNITSSLTCFPIAPSFYQSGYVLPAHSYYEVFITITSGGAVDKLYRDLPILFSWLLVVQILMIQATLHRFQNSSYSK